MRPRSFTDGQLLETAREYFLEHGPGVSTARIAKALGVSQAALFKRFKTKQELMFAALAPTRGFAWIARLEAGPTSAPVRGQLQDRFADIDEFFAEMMPCISVLRSAGLDEAKLVQYLPGDLPPVRAHRALSRYLATLAADGRLEVEHPESVALACIGAIQSRHWLRHVLRERAPDPGEDYVAHLVDFVCRGLNVPQGS